MYKIHEVMYMKALACCTNVNRCTLNCYYYYTTRSSNVQLLARMSTERVEVHFAWA